MTFKLGATGSIPEPELTAIDTTPKTERFGSPEVLQAGLVHFARNCAVCHGPLAISSGVLPDLRWSDYSGDSVAWRDIVRGGILAEAGMIGFDNVLSDADAEAIRAYIVAQAHNAQAQATDGGKVR